MNKHEYIGWIICLMAIMLLAGCGKKLETNTPAQKPMPLVQVSKAEKRDLSKTFTYTGSVEPVKAARMASPAEGPIVLCSVREGDFVNKDQILVKIGRSRITEAGLEAAREEFKRQEAEFKRVEQLVQSGSLPGEQLDMARANLKRAEAQVASMETSASDYEIAAPWDGIVSKVWISEGNYISPRAPLVELYDPSSLIVRIFIPEQQALAVQTNQNVSVALDAYAGKQFNGRIVRVYPELDRSTRTLAAEVTLKEEVRLLSGMFARVDVAVQTLTNAVVIPESALIVLPNGETIVFVLEGDKAVRRKVKVALEAGGVVAIASGIESNDIVITRGNDALKDGTKVQVTGQKKKDSETKNVTDSVSEHDKNEKPVRKGNSAL